MEMLSWVDVMKADHVLSRDRLSPLKRDSLALTSSLLYRGFPTRGVCDISNGHADWKSAIQQVGNLRYIVGAAVRRMSLKAKEPVPHPKEKGTFYRV